jgi:WD40 repeat protein
VAVGRRDGSISIFDLDSGREERKLGQGPMPSAIAWHPDGSKLAAADGPIRGIRVYDSATGRRLFDLQHEPYAGRDVSLAWSPDGAKLAQTCSDGRIYIWDADGLGPPMILRGHPGKATYVAFCHRGDLLATTGWDKTIRLWDPLTGEQLVSITGGGGPWSSSVRMISGWGSSWKGSSSVRWPAVENSAPSRFPHSIFRASNSAPMAG